MSLLISTIKWQALLHNTEYQTQCNYQEKKKAGHYSVGVYLQQVLSTGQGI